MKNALGLPAKPMWGGNIKADMCLPCCSTPFRFFQQRFSQVVRRGKSELLADVYAHRTDVVGRFVENGGNLQDGLATDNQAAHFPLRWCQRRQRCRNVGVLHPAVAILCSTALVKLASVRSSRWLKKLVTSLSVIPPRPSCM